LAFWNIPGRVDFPEICEIKKLGVKKVGGDDKSEVM
jgi:hypothetical protein